MSSTSKPSHLGSLCSHLVRASLECLRLFLSVAKGLQSVTQRRSRLPRLLGTYADQVRQPPSAVIVALSSLRRLCPSRTAPSLSVRYPILFVLLLTLICLSTLPTVYRTSYVYAIYSRGSYFDLLRAAEVPLGVSTTCECYSLDSPRVWSPVLRSYLRHPFLR